MRFSIITPTYKRADLLTRAVESLLRQTYTDWEMIIVNDSPTDMSYTAFASSINDARIHYHVNEINSGVNFSRNRALDNITIDSDWIIFLDDDDYLAPDALETFYDLILSKQEAKWLVTNRAKKDGTPLTLFPKDDNWYSYAWQYLILKRCKGDATHCIDTKTVNAIRFSKHVKQAEEWFFFYQLGLHQKFFYHSHNSTITDGYDAKAGLNFRKRTRGEQFETLSILGYEGLALGILYHPSFLVYLTLRLIRIALKP
ncbi:MAG: glycosyltransferase family A protein [Candidatus Paceibacterota bacterium]